MNTLNRKGAAIITAVMITTVMFILAASIFPIINGSSSIVNNSISRSKLYYLAEYGSVRNMVWVKNIGLDNFMSPESSTVISNGYSISQEIEGNNLSLTATSELDSISGVVIWALSSSATDGDKTCTITLSNVRVTSALKYPTFFAGFGSMGGYFTKDQNFYGRAYFNGEIAFYLTNDETVTFWGEVDSHSSSNSKLEKYENDPLFFAYSKGLNMVDQDGDHTKEEILGILNTETFPGGYNKSQLEQPLDKIVEPWTDILTNYDSYLIGSSYKNHAVFVNFTGGKIIISKDQFITDTLNSNFIKYYDQGIKEIIAYDGNVSLHVKGEVTNDVSVITNKTDIYVDGDFYSSGFSSFKDKNAGLFDGYDADDETHPVNMMKEIDDGIRVGLMGGVDEWNGNVNGTALSDIVVPATTENDQANNIILITAGIFSAKGKLIWDSNFKNHTKLILNGSLIGRGEGVTESWAGTGFSPNYISDKAFSNGDRPPGFKCSVEVDPSTGNDIIIFNDVANWDITWIYN